MSLGSYPSIFAVGHRYLEGLFSGPVTVEEKIDGSQFSFGKEGGVIFARSKGQQIDLDNPPKLFQAGVDTVKALAEKLHDGWVYRGEYLSRPKHNTLAYGRVPNQHIILFDVEVGLQHFLNYGDKLIEANRLGLEVVPLLYEGTISSPTALLDMIPPVSILGGNPAEGVVAKNYAFFGQDKKILIGKVVREGFKEMNGAEWKAMKPGRAEIITRLIDKHNTVPRWLKAVQHLRDEGKLLGEPKDIGLLMREVPEDILKEHEADLREALWDHFWPQIRKGLGKGLAEWYKQQLLEGALGPVVSGTMELADTHAESSTRPAEGVANAA